MQPLGFLTAPWVWNMFFQRVPFAKCTRECVREQGRSRTQTARQRPAQNLHCANAARAPPRIPKSSSILRAPRERPRAEPRLRAISREFVNAARTPPVRTFPLYRGICLLCISLILYLPPDTTPQKSPSSLGTRPPGGDGWE